MAQNHKKKVANRRDGQREISIEVLIGWDHYWENNKGSFYNTTYFVTGLAAFELRLDFDWKKKRAFLPTRLWLIT